MFKLKLSRKEESKLFNEGSSWGQRNVEVAVEAGVTSVNALPRGSDNQQSECFDLVWASHYYHYISGMMSCSMGLHRDIRDLLDLYQLLHSWQTTETIR